MVVDGPAADHVRALKQGEGGDIGIHGSLGLARSLVRERLWSTSTASSSRDRRAVAESRLFG